LAVDKVITIIINSLRYQSIINLNQADARKNRLDRRVV